MVIFFIKFYGFKFFFHSHFSTDLEKKMSYYLSNTCQTYGKRIRILTSKFHVEP